MSDHKMYAVTGEAVAVSVRRQGPTPERYRTALERYLAAVAYKDHDHDHDHQDHDQGHIQDDDHGHHSPLWRLSDIQVRDVMTRDVVSVRADVGFKEIVAALAQIRVSAVPVVDGEGRVLGVVSESDLVTRLITGGPSGDRVPGRHGERRDIRRKSVADTAGTLMTSPPVTIRPTASLVEAARTAAKAHVRRLPVVDDEGVIVGIVTRVDLLTVFLREDDELRDLIRKEVLTSRFCADPSTVEVVVEDGVVTLAGQLERRMQIAPLVEAARAVAGVVSVHNELTYRVDDRIYPVVPGPMY